MFVPTKPVAGIACSFLQGCGLEGLGCAGVSSTFHPHPSPDKLKEVNGLRKIKITTLSTVPNILKWNITLDLPSQLSGGQLSRKWDTFPLRCSLLSISILLRDLVVVLVKIGHFLTKMAPVCSGTTRDVTTPFSS